MEHSPRAQELLTGLRAAFPGLRPLEEGDLPLVFALYQRNTFFNSVALEAPPTLESCREDLAALPPGREPRHKLFLGLFQGEVLAAVLDLVEGYPGEGTLYIGLLELEAPFHRQGLGTRLVRALKPPPKRPGFPPCAWGVMSATPRAWPFGTPWGLRRRGRSCGKGAPCIKCISPYRPSRLAGTPKERYNTRTRSASGQKLSRCLRQQRPPIVKKGRKKGVDKI